MVSFLSMVFFVCGVQIFAYRYTIAQNEQAFRARVNENMESVNARLSQSVFSLYDISAMVCANALVQENLRPYSQMTAAQRYYYGAIISLLSQTRLQYTDLVDSVFMYADTERVLYASNENGLSESGTFFSLLMRYQQYDQTYWETLLQTPRTEYAILAPDSYTTTRVGDQRGVIPVVYVCNKLGTTNVLTMNLSIEQIGRLFSESFVFAGMRCLLYGEDGKALAGGADAPALPDAGSRVTIDGTAYYAARVYQPALRLHIVSLTPASAYLDILTYFRVTMLALFVAFALFGFLVAVFMSRRVYHPIEKVREDISSIGDLPANAVSYENELESIRGGISALVSDREQTRRENRQHSLHYVSQGFANLLSGRRLTDEKYFLDLLRRDHGFVYDAYRCAVILLDADSRGDYRTVQPLMNELSERVTLLMNKAGIAFVRVHYQWNMLVLIFNMPSGNENDAAALCEGFLAHDGEDAACSLRIGIGGETGELSDIPESFEQANSAVLAMPADTSDMIRVWRPQEMQTAYEYDRRGVITAVNSCNIKNMEEALEEELSAVKKNCASYREAAGIVHDLYETAISAQERMSGKQMLIRSQRKVEPDPMEILLSSPTVNVTPLVTALLHHLPPESGKTEKLNEELAARAKAYIDANYMCELSLDIIADALNVSAKYLSRTFKQALGVNLTDYLAYVRVERVKELLSGDFSMEQISEKVGITNRTTFIRTFRKMEGMTPSEYKTLH